MIVVDILAAFMVITAGIVAVIFWLLAMVKLTILIMEKMRL